MSESKNTNTTFGSIIGAIVLVGAVWFYFGGGLEKQAGRDMQQIENQVAADAVKQYEIAKRNGSATDAYTQAALVAESFLQAKDEANYQKWVAVRKAEAARARVPDSFSGQ